MLLTSTVLRMKPHREHDRLYTVYTRERGKLSVLGVGHAKITSKLAGHLGQFVISELAIVPGRVWDKIIAAETLERFDDISGKLSRIGSALSLLELVDALTRENHPDQGLWDLLINAMRQVSIGRDSGIIREKFEHEALSILGFRSPLEDHLTQKLNVPEWLLLGL